MKRLSKKLKILSLIVLLFLLATLVIFAYNRYKVHQNIYKEYATYAGKKITYIEYRYFFHKYADEFINTDYAIIDYIGLQPEVDYKEQIHNAETGETWEDFFEKQAVKKIKEIAIMVKEAEEIGFELTKEEKNAYLKRAKVELQDNASSHSMTLNQYISSKYVAGATFNDLEDTLLDEALYIRYKQSLYSDIDVSEDVVTNYYNEHQEKYNLVTFRSCLLSVTEYMNDVAYNIDNEEIEDEDAFTEQLLSEAKEKALNDAHTIMDETDSQEKFEELCHKYAPKEVRDGHEDEDISLSEKKSYTDTSSAYRDWLFDEDRKEGDMSIIYSNNGMVAYVVYYINKEPNVTKKKTYYQIFLPYEASNNAMGPTEEEKTASLIKSKKLYDEITANCVGNLDAFKKYADKHNKDTATKDKHGYKKEIEETALTEPLKEWLCSDGRTAGDIGFVEDSMGAYILYFEEETEPSWYANAQNDYRGDVYNEKLKSLEEKYGIEIGE